MPRVSINGTQLYVEESGSGPEIIVFSHGLFWSSAMFAPQISALRTRYRCVAYDHRGQGQSQIPSPAYDMETLAEDAAGLLDSLGMGPVHWVGLSMGGFIGMRLAARKPESIRSLALLNTAADHEPFRLKYKALGAAARLLGIKPFVGEAMRSMFGNTFLADPSRAVFRNELRARLASLDLRGALPALAAVTDRKPVEDELTRIRCPTLVLAGEEDRSIAPERSRKTAGLIPGARFAVVPRAGHTSTLEEPAAVTEALREFLGALVLLR